MKPKVSVIMAVLNGECFIDEAIQSIVDQTYKNVELVVVDDGSTDRTRDRVDAFRDRLEIQYVRHETPRGIAPSMNDGVRHATGELITFLDHDDAWVPDFLQTQTSYLDEHPDVGMVHCDFQTIDPQGAVIQGSIAAWRGRSRPSGSVFPQLFMDSFVVGNSVLIRRECFARLGLFDESLRWGDYLMWMRIARHYRVDYVDRVLTKYRQHPTQSTRNLIADPPDAPPAALKAIERVLELYPEIRAELGERTVRHRIASFYFDRAYCWYVAGQPGSARVCLWRALRLWPTNARYLTLYMATLLRPSQVQKARRAWRLLTGRGAGTPPVFRGSTG
jgi:glycosyltransferase involved in cell wall biosynthesis